MFLYSTIKKTTKKHLLAPTFNFIIIGISNIQNENVGKFVNIFILEQTKWTNAIMSRLVLYLFYGLVRKVHAY